MLYTITPYYKIICRQKSNFFRIPETVETSKNWVIEEVEKELVEDPASLESSSGTSGEPVISTSEFEAISIVLSMSWSSFCL